MIFAAKCRKSPTGEGVDGVDVLPPEASLQVTAVEPSNPEPNVSFEGVVYGTGFEAGAEVFVGAQGMSSVRFRDANSLVVTVPGLAAGGYDVMVRNPDGSESTLRAGMIVRSAPALSEECRSFLVGFDLDSATLDASAQQTLTGKAECFSVPNISVRVEGHCDERGTTEYNLALGQRRADTVKRYLAAQGIGQSRISAMSYGEEKPLQAGHNEAAWAENRRAEILISD